MNRNKAKGFVLVEVLMAITVLTIGAVFVAQSYHASSSTARESRELYAAALLMEGKVAEIEKTGDLRAEPHEDALLGTVTVTREQSTSDIANLGRHQVMLAWGEGRRARSLEQTIYVWE